MGSSNAPQAKTIIPLAPLRFTLVLTLSALVALACASGPSLRYRHEFNLSPGQTHHAGLAKALLLPIDATNEQPVSGLDVANDRIGALTKGHLASKGIAVEEIDRTRFEELRHTALQSIQEKRKSGASGRISAFVHFEELVPEIVAALGSEPDLVVGANIVMRNARYEGKRMIVWDGVRRRETIRSGTMSGDNLPAASLYVAVYARDGAKLFSGYGGLEPPFRVNRSARRYDLREDLFEDERNLSEGVCVAFYPYFGMEEFCSP